MSDFQLPDYLKDAPTLSPKAGASSDRLSELEREVAAKFAPPPRLSAGRRASDYVMNLVTVFVWSTTICVVVVGIGILIFPQFQVFINFAWRLVPIVVVAVLLSLLAMLMVKIPVKALRIPEPTARLLYIVAMWVGIAVSMWLPGLL